MRAESVEIVLELQMVTYNFVEQGGLDILNSSYTDMCILKMYFLLNL